MNYPQLAKSELDQAQHWQELHIKSQFYKHLKKGLEAVALHYEEDK